MTPLMLQILLHHRTMPDPYSPDCSMSKAESAAYVELKQLDLLTERGETTPRGKAYIETLLDAPLPEMQWVKPTWTMKEKK